MKVTLALFAQLSLLMTQHQLPQKPLVLHAPVELMTAVMPLLCAAVLLPEVRYALMPLKHALLSVMPPQILLSATPRMHQRTSSSSKRSPIPSHCSLNTLVLTSPACQEPRPSLLQELPFLPSPP